MKSFLQVLIVLLSFLNMAFAGTSEEEVKKAIQKINADVQQINSLAQQGKIDESLDLLDKLNSFINTEISWGSISYDMQKKAKKENPNFTFSLNIKLPEQFSTTLYENKLSLCEKHMKLTEETKEGLQAMKDLNNMDKLYAYLQMAKKSYDAAKDMMEDYTTGNVPKAIYDVYNNSKELYEGVKQIYETYQEDKNIKSFQESVKMVVDRAEKSKKKYEYLIFKINLWKKDINQFQANMNNILKIKNQVDNEPVTGMSFADRKYNWDYGPFQKKVKGACDDFEKYDIKCPEFQKNYDEIITGAKNSWKEIYNNIYNSDDKDNKPKFLTEHKDKWTEFEGVVKPIFEKTYNKYCGALATKTEETKNTPTATDGNNRSLYIKDLTLGSPSGMVKLYFEPRAEVKVSFKAIWDGKWMDRVKMKILIDNSEIVDEMLEFRDNMGKFRTDFSKTIQLPSSLENGSHTLSLVMERDPKIINKSITLSCSPRQVNFKVGEETSASTTKSNVTADMFSGASAKNKVEVVPEKTPAKKTTASGKSTYKVTDKYWENTIPENAQVEWIKEGIKYEVRFTVNGRTVGYRTYKDDNFRIPTYEAVLDNLLVTHGAVRWFEVDRKTKKVSLTRLAFYCANIASGPDYRVNLKDHSVSVNYYIDGKNVSESEYIQKAKSGANLPPYDIYNEEKWHKIPYENIPNPVKSINADNLAFDKLTVPDDVVKYISARYLDSGDILEYTEYYYTKKSPHFNVGMREWDIKGGRAVLVRESIMLGNKEVHRFWDRETGKLNNFYIKYRKLQNGQYADKKIVGPRLVNNGSKTNYYNLDDRAYTLNAYQILLGQYPELPPSDIIDRLRVAPGIAPNSVPDPGWAGSELSKLNIPSNAAVWRVYYDNDFAIRMIFYVDHDIVGMKGWYDREMKLPRYKVLYSEGQEIYSAYWNRDGQLTSLRINGKLKSYGLGLRVNQDGKVIHSFGGKEDEKGIKLNQKAYSNFDNIPSIDNYDLSSLKRYMGLVQIPQSEKTELFKAVWNNYNITTGANTNIAYQPQNNSTTRIDQPDNTNVTDEADYKKLQREELETLGKQVSEKMEKADKAFDKPYWENKSAPQTTLQASNPKQESLDLMHQAAQIASRAKYSENRIFMNYSLAYKLLNYSGRVFSNKAKEDFFQLAAQLVNTSDQFVSQIKNLKTKEELSDMYCTTAEVWREMTRKAQWGSHAYNKMECDKKVIHQYERALSIDPNNARAKKMLEQLKAPKKAVPEAVAKFEEIRPETWNEAQTLVAKLNDEVVESETQTKGNFLEVAEMTLNTGAGKVYMMRMGSSKWEEVTDSHILIFPGDKIKTSSDAKDVSVTYTSDKAYLAIKPDAEVEFYSENKLLIKRGDAYVDVTKKGSKFLVITPTCAVGVRGTTFEVKVSPDKTTETFLYKGVVETRSGSDVGYLVPGQKMVAKKGAPKLEQTEFNVQKRLASDWRDVESQRRNHEKLKLAAVKKTGTPTARATVKPRTSNTSLAVYPLHVSPSPDGQYHELLSKSAVEYGDALLVARCPVKVSRNMPLTVNWYLNNQSQPINVGNYQIVPQATFFDAAIISYDAPLNPGSYRAEFVMGGKIIGRNTIQITVPKRLDAKTAQEFYVETVRALDLSITTLGQGNFAQAGQLCSEAMPLLRAALYSAPNLPDIFTVMHATRSVYALGQADAALRKSDKQRALLWVIISRGYVDRSLEKCQDEQLKTLLQNLQALIGQIQSKLN
ncbi:MAG: FecR domain-containing protein [Bacteroidales bacterium]|nr:FecR domain-containing protein [Bacteroidales bacterium]